MLALETRLGWRGLCIEPNPVYWVGLTHRACTVVSSFVGSQQGASLNFSWNAEYTRGMDSSGAERRTTARLGNILRVSGAPKLIDYLSLDVEGMEESVMMTFPWDHYSIHAMTVERPSDGLKANLLSHGFVEAKKHGWFGDILYLNSSMPDFQGALARALKTPSVMTHEEYRDSKRPGFSNDLLSGGCKNDRTLSRAEADRV